MSSFGGSRENFEYLTRETDHSFPDGAYVFLDEPRRVNLLFTDADLSDFLLPNGNYHSAKFEVLSYITDERQTVDGSAYLLATETQPTSETSASPILDVVGNVFSNMPPRREGYVRRETLEEELIPCLPRRPESSGNASGSRRNRQDITRS